MSNGYGATGKCTFGSRTFGSRTFAPATFSGVTDAVVVPPQPSEGGGSGSGGGAGGGMGGTWNGGGRSLPTRRLKPVYVQVGRRNEDEEEALILTRVI